MRPLLSIAAGVAAAVSVYAFLRWLGRESGGDAEGQPPAQHAPGPDSGLVEHVDALKLYNASKHRPGHGKRWWWYGYRPDPIPAYRGPFEKPSANVAGVCCSGGGIRSAAFNLGALQSLQGAGELHKASYLAAVSGGSYIAAAFATIARTWPRRGRPPNDPDEPDNGRDDSNPSLFGPGREAFYPDSPEEQFLRNRTSYLAPNATGKLILGYRIVLGLLVNLLFVGMPFFGVMTLLGVFVYRLGFPDLTGSCTQECGATIPLGWVLPSAILGALSAVFGVIALLRRFKKDENRALYEVWSARFLALASVLALLMILMPLLVDATRSSSQVNAARTGTKTGAVGAAGGAGFAALLAGVVLQLREAFATPPRAIEGLGRGRKWLQGLSSKVRLAIVYLAAAVIGPAILLAVMVVALSLALAQSKHGPDWALAGVGAGVLALFAFLYAYVDLTSWSLHPFYKRRLGTVFSLKRVKPSDLVTNPAKIEQDEEFGIAVEREYDRPVRLSQTALRVGPWPTLIVCAAANVSDPGATPPGRQVTSFTFSAHSIGGPLVGGIPTRAFEDGLDKRRKRDFTLLAAVAMSGAAISPSMGKMTRRPLTFLMALANLRLGVWVPNPRRLRAWTNRSIQRLPYPRPRPSYLFRELIGRNRVNAKFLFVTDGGHYENLGLVELLRRGCGRIYCFDASGGEGFQELGDAIALARSELGVSIDIDPTSLTPGKHDLAKRNAVRGKIVFRDGTEGILVYARNVMTAKSPADVKAYHQRDPKFPHNPTADQLYTDQKFEGYRELGELAGARAVELMRAAAGGP